MVETIPPATPPGELLCPQCGYDVREIASERCPECGLAIDRAAFATSQIPWAYRKALGPVRAYMRTLLRYSFRPARLIDEAKRPVAYREAQLFRLATVLLASVPAGVGVLVFYWALGGSSFYAMPLEALLEAYPLRVDAPVSLILPWVAGASLWPTMPLALMLLFLLISGVPSYWCHPRSIPIARQNRAIALSYYASGALSLTSIAMILLLIANAIQLHAMFTGRPRTLSPTQLQIYFAAFISGVSILLLIASVLFVNVIQLQRHVVRAGWKWTAWSILGICFAWIACFVVALGVVPWNVGLVRVMIESLT